MSYSIDDILKSKNIRYPHTTQIPLEEMAVRMGAQIAVYKEDIDHLLSMYKELDRYLRPDAPKINCSERLDLVAKSTFFYDIKLF